jgi:hypothetical protein
MMNHLIIIKSYPAIISSIDIYQVKSSCCGYLAPLVCTEDKLLDEIIKNKKGQWQFSPEKNKFCQLFSAIRPDKLFFRIKPTLKGIRFCRVLSPLFWIE